MGRRGELLVIALLLAPASAFAQKKSEPEIHYATGDEADQIRDALKKIPDCWKKCAADPELGLTEDLKIGVTPADRSGAAYYVFDMSGDKVKEAIVIDQLSLRGKGSKAAAQDEAAYQCAAPNTQVGSTDDLVRTLTHEYGHRQHHNCSTEKVTKFSSHFFKKRRALRTDPEYRAALDARTKVLDEASAIWHAKHPGKDLPEGSNDTLKALNSVMTPEMQKRNCDAQKKISEIYRKHGMPVRAEGDTHAAEPGKSNLEEDGSEYFAIAIETLFFDPNEFCARFTAEEIQELQDSFGECLAQFKRPMPPCWNTPRVNVSIPNRPTGSFLQP